MPDHHPRYVVSSDRLWIYDRWYCHREVYHAREYGDGRRADSERLAEVRSVLARLNAEHEAWLRAG